MKIFNSERALQRAQALCSRQEKCEFDIQMKLISWGATTEEAAKIIASLVRDSFVNNLRFAKLFAAEKARINKWGPKKIEMALRVKRIDDEGIKISLLELGESFSDEKLQNLIKSKIKSIRAKDRYELKAKLIRFGVSRGFVYNQVVDIVEKILRDNLDY